MMGLLTWLLSTPGERRVLYVAERLDRLSAEQIGRIEKKTLGRRFTQEDRDLLRAMRLAAGVHRIKEFRTLENRHMDIFHPVNGTWAPSLCSRHRGFQVVMAAIHSVFVRRFCELVRQKSPLSKKQVEAAHSAAITLGIDFP